MTRRRFEWKIANTTLILGERTLIMGVLNVTPDSFSDGGRYMDPDLAYARALEMEDQGADILDIGAESTRPGSERISEAEELRRLIPVLKRLKEKLGIPICVDTYKPGVAAKALEHGAQIINDPSGLTWEPELAKVVRGAGAGLVINHMRGTPETWATLPPVRDVIGTVASELSAAVHRARRDGIPGDSIVVDPGFGFGKRKEQNSELLARLEELRSRVEQPVLVGPSRKSFLAQADPRDTEFATAAAVAVAILNGAAIVRVHDIPSMRAAAGVADTVLAALPEPLAVEPRRKDKDKGAGPRRDRIAPEVEEQGPKTLVWRPQTPDRGQRPEDVRKRDQPLIDRKEDRRPAAGARRQQEERRQPEAPRSGIRDESKDRRPPRTERETADDRGRVGRSPTGRPGRRPDSGAPSGPGRPPGRRSEGGPPRHGGRPPVKRSGPPRRGGPPGSGREEGRSSTGGGGDKRPPRQSPPSGAKRSPRSGPSRGGGRPQGGGAGGARPPRKPGGKPNRYGGGPPPRKRS